VSGAGGFHGPASGSALSPQSVKRSARRREDPMRASWESVRSDVSVRSDCSWRNNPDYNINSKSHSGGNRRNSLGRDAGTKGNTTTSASRDPSNANWTNGKERKLNSKDSENNHDPAESDDDTSSVVPTWRRGFGEGKTGSKPGSESGRSGRSTREYGDRNNGDAERKLFGEHNNRKSGHSDSGIGSKNRFRQDDAKVTAEKTRAANTNSNRSLNISGSSGETPVSPGNNRQAPDKDKQEPPDKDKDNHKRDKSPANATEQSRSKTESDNNLSNENNTNINENNTETTSETSKTPTRNSGATATGNKRNIRGFGSWTPRNLFRSSRPSTPAVAAGGGTFGPGKNNFTKAEDESRSGRDASAERNSKLKIG
jgi:hypothetical protein